MSKTEMNSFTCEELSEWLNNAVREHRSPDKCCYFRNRRRVALHTQFWYIMSHMAFGTGGLKQNRRRVPEILNQSV